MYDLFFVNKIQLVLLDQVEILLLSFEALYIWLSLGEPHSILLGSQLGRLRFLHQCLLLMLSLLFDPVFVLLGETFAHRSQGLCSLCFHHDVFLLAIAGLICPFELKLLHFEQIICALLLSLFFQDAGYLGLLGPLLNLVCSLYRLDSFLLLEAPVSLRHATTQLSFVLSDHLFLSRLSLVNLGLLNLALLMSGFNILAPLLLNFILALSGFKLLELGCLSCHQRGLLVLLIYLFEAV